MSKQKFPRAEARLVAFEMLNHLVNYCDRLEVAGSYRRGTSEVGDLEFVYVPRTVAVPVDLLGGTVAEDQVCKCLDALVKTGTLARRLNINGCEAWGAKNRLAVHVSSGMPLDFFGTTVANWFNYLVCRTGPAASNIAICQAAQRRGWHWKPYAAGFQTIHGMIPVASEREVFELVGLPYREPGER